MVDLTTRDNIWLEDIKIVGQSTSIVWEKLEWVREKKDIVLRNDAGEVYFKTASKGLGVYEVLNDVVDKNPYALRKVALRLIMENGRGTFGFKNMDLLITIDESITITIPSTDVFVIYEDTKLNYAILNDAYEMLQHAEVSDDIASKIMHNTKKFPYDINELKRMLRRVPSIRHLCFEKMNALEYEEKNNSIHYDMYRSRFRTIKN